MVTAYSTALDNYSALVTKTAESLYATRASVIAVRNRYNPPAPALDNFQGQLNRAYEGATSFVGNNTGMVMLAVAAVVAVVLLKRAK